MPDSTPLSAQEHHRLGLRLMQAGSAEALEHLSSACGADPDNPTYRSAYGLGLALIGRRFRQGLALAQETLGRDSGNPELYLNLARIYRAFGFPGEAVRSLKRGLMIRPDDLDLQRELDELGRRSATPLRFLPRDHFLNRWLGRLRSRFARRQDDTSDATDRG